MSSDDYLRRVDRALRDLPWRMRRNLVTELGDHLAELPPGSDVAARLGPPDQYAADLRAAAGLERRHGPVAFVRARRPRNVILVVLALTAIGLAIGAVEWIDSYQPIAFSNGMTNPAGAVEAPGGDGESVVFHEGRPFRLGIAIKNTGRFAVRVLGVPYGSGLPFSARLLMSVPMKTSGFPPPLVPFRPFDLRAGEVRVLQLEGVYANCPPSASGSAVVIAGFPVRFRFLWRKATATIPLPEKLAIVFPKGAGCG